MTNSIFRYLKRPDLKPLLKSLVEQSAVPLAIIEANFAVDATGFSTSTYACWHDHKYGGKKRGKRKKADWIKLHAAVGTLTNVVTAVEVTDSRVGDSPMLVPLVTATAQNFTMREVSADKAYLKNDNLTAIESLGAAPYIPFKSNSTSHGSLGNPAWKRLYHLYSLRREEFNAHYHQRSNVETTFSMIKKKFGHSVRSKLLPAQLNEVLLKVLCHNLSVLVHSIHELGIEPVFGRHKQALA